MLSIASCVADLLIVENHFDHNQQCSRSLIQDCRRSSRIRQRSEISCPRSSRLQQSHSYYAVLVLPSRSFENCPCAERILRNCGSPNRDIRQSFEFLCVRQVLVRLRAGPFGHRSFANCRDALISIITLDLRQPRATLYFSALGVGSVFGWWLHWFCWLLTFRPICKETRDSGKQCCSNECSTGTSDTKSNVRIS
jgi:hypothetical protein